MSPRHWTRLSRRRATAFASLALASAFCVAAIAVRTVYTGRPSHVFLVWNLVLAWIPFALALLVYDRYRRGSSLLPLAPLAFGWLVFFPNAPYLITDLVHLSPYTDVPQWFDVFTFAAFAWTGMLLGFASLYLLQSVVKELLGALASWVFVVAALGLGSFGVYLGRVHRLNSWQVFSDPMPLASDVWARLQSPVGEARMVGMTLFLTAFLAVAYFVLYSFLNLAGAQAERPETT
jgi:uncharacterized membrane protein